MGTPDLVDASAAALVHDALLYTSDAEYIAGIREFLEGGIDEGAALLVSVPGPKLALLRTALPHLDDRFQSEDMREVGVNPARIIPFIRSFVEAHPDRPVRFVGEPIWAGRSAPEIVEGVRHEGLINRAFADTSAYILCPYDARDLTPAVLSEARRTHPTLLCDGERRPCAEYVDPLVTYAAADRPLPEPAVVPLAVSVEKGLVTFRSVVKEQARAAGIEPDRVASFVIAANEAAANTLIHAHGDGSARIWSDEHELVCELADTGVIHDPLVGRRMPPPDREGGRGVWLMNQLSDLVELRSGPQGTVVRIHVRRR
jgi:anti-sigma regulatory factor (Ser/Thr protein kinase)